MDEPIEITTTLNEFKEAWSQIEHTEERRNNMTVLMKAFGATDEEIEEILGE